MHRTDMAPSPINLVTTWVVYLLRMCQRGIFLFSCSGSIVVVYMLRMCQRGILLFSSCRSIVVECLRNLPDTCLIVEEESTLGKLFQAKKEKWATIQKWTTAWGQRTAKVRSFQWNLFGSSCCSKGDSLVPPSAPASAKGSTVRWAFKHVFFFKDVFFLHFAFHLRFFSLASLILLISL